MLRRHEKVLLPWARSRLSCSLFFASAVFWRIFPVLAFKSVLLPVVELNWRPAFRPCPFLALTREGLAGRRLSSQSCAFYLLTLPYGLRFLFGSISSLLIHCNSQASSAQQAWLALSGSQPSSFLDYRDFEAFRFLLESYGPSSFVFFSSPVYHFWPYCICIRFSFFLLSSFFRGLSFLSVSPIRGDLFSSSIPSLFPSFSVIFKPRATFLLFFPGR